MGAVKIGLDGFLFASRYIWSSSRDDEDELKKRLKKCFPRVKYEIKSVKFEVLYWRKANAIHKWFVETVQEGNDDCGTYYVSREQLKELLDLITEALKPKDSKKLPTTEGFFFGGTDYDEWYWDTLERTKNELNAILKDDSLKDFDFDYHSSW